MPMAPPGRRGKEAISDCYNPSVSEASTERQVSAAGRVMGRAAGGNRWVRAFSSVTGALTKAGRVLWLEVTGFFFVVFTVIGGAAFFREHQSGAAIHKQILVGVFTAMFAWFAVTSFWRAQK